MSFSLHLTMLSSIQKACKGDWEETHSLDSRASPPFTSMFLHILPSGLETTDEETHGPLVPKLDNFASSLNYTKLVTC